MRNHAEESVSTFYNTKGWKTEGEITEDAKKWEDLRAHARAYVSRCRLRILRHIPENGMNILDMASGPIQYREYLAFSENFEKRYCIDLSSDALRQAGMKIGAHGVFLHGSFFDIGLEENFFDCAVSLHTIYHMDKERQEGAVRKLLHVTKPGKPVIIVYSNPNSIILAAESFLRLFKRAAPSLNKQKNEGENGQNPILYYHAHPISWWRRFSDSASVKILPWRSFDADTQKKIIPDNRTGRKMLDILFDLEDRFPNFFVRFFQYPMIILTKK